MQIVNSLQVGHASAGATLAADHMPGAVFDALRICEYESKNIDAAMEESLST